MSPDSAPVPYAEEREPPHNFHLEQALLGGILVNNAAYWRVAEFLKPEHFADPLHGRIFEACGRLIERIEVADHRTVGTLFQNDATLAKAGQADYLSKLAFAAISIIDTADYGRQIRDMFLRRQLIEVGETLVNDSYDFRSGASAADLIDAAEGILYAVDSGGHADDRLRDARGALADTFTGIEEAMREHGLPENERRARRIITGIATVDDVLQLKRGDNVVLAAASSMGKSALADNIAEANERNGVPTAIFSLEMRAAGWKRRRLTRATGIPERAMIRGDLTQDQFNQLWEARERLEQRPMWIDDKPDLTASRLRSRLRRLKRSHNIGLAIVDYIQLMSPERTSRRDGNRAQDISEITRAMKLAASELDICLIGLSQLSRSINAREDRRPDLANLRESGSIEQDADSVIFIYREEYYLAQQKPQGRGGKPPTAQDLSEYFDRMEKCKGLAEIFIGKQRHGEARVTVTCRWDGSRTQFSDLPQETPPHQNELL